MSVPHSTRLRTRLTGKLRPGRDDRPIDRLPLPTLVTAAAREPLRRKSAVNALALRPAVLILALSANAEPAQRECSNCCADRQCRNRSTRLIVSPLPPGDTSICHLVATAAPTHGQVRRDANSSRSQAEPVLPAQVDPTVDPPVAEEVPNEHSNAPHPTGTTNRTLSTPGTKIVALLDLSQDTDSGEVQVTDGGD